MDQEHSEASKYQMGFVCLAALVSWIYREGEGADKSLCYKEGSLCGGSLLGVTLSKG